VNQGIAIRLRFCKKHRGFSLPVVEVYVAE
jgi:hypothetical protein